VAFTALYDACVLYPAPIRDVLMRLALTDVYRARWTHMIHEEWINALLEKRLDLERAQLERTRDLMNAHVRDALITGFEDLIPSLQLPDPEDRQVLAAAIRGRVDVIVTYNLKDFPEAVLTAYDLEVQHPDEFLTHVIDLAPGSVVEAIKGQRASLKNPPVATDDFLATLEQCELPTFVARLREFHAVL
jgi:predicted nucleic acid-binding protein